jgi:hypothetical protein
MPAIEFWLKWIKDDLNYSPERVMIDNSQTEMGAIRNTFGDQCGILVCHWHILKSWKLNIVKKVKPTLEASRRLSSGEVKTHRDLAMSVLVKMMTAHSEDMFEEGYQDLQAFADKHDDWDSAALLVYFDQTYLGTKMMWCNAWRNVSSVQSGYTTGKKGGVYTIRLLWSTLVSFGLIWSHLV